MALKKPWPLVDPQDEEGVYLVTDPQNSENGPDSPTLQVLLILDKGPLRVIHARRAIAFLEESISRGWLDGL